MSQFTWSEDVEWGAPPPPIVPSSNHQQQHPFVASSRHVEVNDNSYESRRCHVEGGPHAVYGDEHAAYLSKLKEEDDAPLDDFEETEHGFPEQEPILLIEDVAEEDKDENEREFMAVKPWLGAMYPPSEYIKDPKNPHKVFTEEDNNWAAPDVKLDLDYIFGYRARDCRDNLHWINDNHVVFPAAAVGVILNLQTTDEDFFYGHDDDIVCMDYHKETNMVASGSIGARNTVRLCLWHPNVTDMNGQKATYTIMGFHQFAVVSVAFNPQGTIVASIGMDEHHSVALYCTRTATLLACAPADKNRLVHCRFNTSESVCSATHFVTVGVKHISFWTPKDVTLPHDKVGNKNYYFSTSDDVEQRMDFQRGYGCDEIDAEGFCFYSVDFSPFHALCGASNGCVYMFNSKTWDISRKVQVSTHRVLSIQHLDQQYCNFAVGCGSGKIHLYTARDDETGVRYMEPSKSVLPTGDSIINMNLLDEATDNESDVLVNSVRSMSLDPSTNKLLVGTILHHIYSVDLNKTSTAKPIAKVLLGGHWCNLNKEEKGELWGVDAHPTKQWVITTNDDCTIRLWDLVNNVEISRRHLKFRGYKCSFSQDGTMVAVGHRNGSFSVFSHDLQAQVWPNTRHRTGKVCDIQFSPSSEFLAVAADRFIDVYRISEVTDEHTGAKRKHFRRIGICKGHTSYLKSFDWNVNSSVIQSGSKGYEILNFSIPDCRRIAGTKVLADEVWFTQTTIVGWGVQGIWPRFADGSDINSVGKSRSHKWLSVTDDWGCVKLYNYPCVGGGLDRRTGLLKIRPDCHTYPGHCSHVTNCVWTYDDTYLCTTGGADLCMFCWKVDYGKGETLKPTKFFNSTKIDEIKAHVEKARAKEEARAARKEDQTAASGSWSLREDGEEGSNPGDTSASTTDGTPQPAPWALPTDCYMCGFVYPDISMKTCARCFAPRKKPASTYQAVWNGKLSRERVPVKARFHLPTTSFARYTKAQQEQKKTVDEKPAEKVWMPGSTKQRSVNLGIELSDSDEDTCRQTVMKKSVPKPAPKKKKGPKTNGPDFADL